MFSDDLVNHAVKFHGHFGPFLVLGLRAGLVGVRHLGKSYFELKATVSTNLKPPRSCFIDGIQFTSGCTTGKGNLEVKASGDVSVTFEKGSSKISLTVRDDILKALDQMKSDEQAEASGREIMQKPDDDLFIVKKD